MVSDFFVRIDEGVRADPFHAVSRGDLSEHRVVVEDRAHVVSTAIPVCFIQSLCEYGAFTDGYAYAQAWGPQYCHLFESGRMSYRTRDFFQSWDPLTLPDLGPISSPAVFLVRLVLHDWQDDDARK